MPDMQPHRLGLSELSCREFLESHSDYLDHLLAPGETRRFDQHVTSCRSCENYDRVVRRGLLFARNLSDIQPSDHFHERLQARLMGLENEPVVRPVMANSATVVVIAAVLALVALTPLLRFMVVPGAAVSPPLAAPVALPNADPIPMGFGPAMRPPIAGSTATFKFTPILVQPPVIQSMPSAPRLIAYPMVQTATR